MLVLAATLPVDLAPDEPALLTLSAYLHRQNPDDKFHPSHAYDWGVDHENKIGTHAERYSFHGDQYAVNVLPSGFIFFTDNDQSDHIVAYIQDNTLFHDVTVKLGKVPHWYRTDPHRDATNTQIKWTSEQLIKYPSRIVAEQTHKERIAYIDKWYPVTLQHIKVQGRDFVLRSEKEPDLNSGASLVLLNDKHEVVASASNEWGATLIHVTQEYRGLGLGPILTKEWYKNNPKFRSGGYTTNGRAQAARFWASRVREFLSNGWYSELVKEGKLTKDFVKEVITDLTKVPVSNKSKSDATVDETKLLVLSDDTYFAIFDYRFIESRSDEHIYGYGFLRDNKANGYFFYRIDWDEGYENLTKKVAMQMAYDLKEKIYVGGLPADIVDFSDVPGVEINNGYAEQTKSLFDLKSASRTTAGILRKASPHGEVQQELIEEAEGKQW